VVRILAALQSQAGDNPLRIALAAPTGKAAARVQEAIRRQKADPHLPETLLAAIPDSASTLHRLLGARPDSVYFRHNRDHPLPVDVVVVDEASMVDLALMAKLAIVLDDWMDANSIDATAIQCWTSIQQNYGVNACTVMSMMSERLMPSACEVDIAGTASMYALTLAAGTPAALVDWNNNYNDEPDKCLYFHCGNWAKSLGGNIELISAEVLGATLGAENTWGALQGRTSPGPLTYARIDTDDRHGLIHAYVGEGRFTDDPLSTISGSHAVVEVPELQRLLRHICRHGFAHHAAMTKAHVAGIVAEAFENYLGWEVYHHA